MSSYVKYNIRSYRDLGNAHNNSLIGFLYAIQDEVVKTGRGKRLHLSPRLNPKFMY